MSAPVLQEGETISASTVIRASADEVYAVVSDVTRIPEWSPECIRCEWLDEDRFKGWNRRALARWSTTSRVVVADPGREFSFAVQVGKGDFTRWTYRIEPGDEPGTSRLTEEFQMCTKLIWPVVVYERLLLRVKDRRTDLQENLDSSLRRIREIIEA